MQSTSQHVSIWSSLTRSEISHFQLKTHLHLHLSHLLLRKTQIQGRKKPTPNNKIHVKQWGKWVWTENVEASQHRRLLAAPKQASNRCPEGQVVSSNLTRCLWVPCTRKGLALMQSHKPCLLAKSNVTGSWDVHLQGFTPWNTMTVL